MVDEFLWQLIERSKIVHLLEDLELDCQPNREGRAFSRIVDPFDL